MGNFGDEAVSFHSQGNHANIENSSESPSQLSFEEHQLVIDNLDLVEMLASMVGARMPSHVDRSELISAGMLGLVESAKRFDRSKGIQFSTFAQFRIRGAMLDCLRTMDWGTRELRHRARAVENAIRELTAKLQHFPNEAEVAEHLEMSLAAYHKLVADIDAMELGTLNIETNQGQGDELLTLIPSSDDSTNPLLCCMRKQMQRKLAAAIEELSERERVVITLYYFEGMTNLEIGLAIGVGESRVSQIRGAATSKLRSRLEEKPARRKPPERAIPAGYVSTARIATGQALAS